MVRFTGVLTALFFFWGVSGGALAAGDGERLLGILIAAKDKEKEEKALKEKEDRLEAWEEELKDREKTLKKKEEGLKKKEDSLKKKARRFQQRTRQGSGAGPQDSAGGPPGFGPKTSAPASGKQGDTGPVQRPPAAAPAFPANP